MYSSILSKVKQLALDKYGIRLQEHQFKKIEHELECFATRKNIQDLEKYLLNSNDGDKSLENFIVDIITINESYFFRDLSLFSALRNEILPNLIAKKRETVNKDIRIWSVGSSCGQEIYSISILLHEILGDTNAFKITLYGTDISNECIGLARKGEYSKFAFRSTDPAIKDKYFKESSDNRGLYQLDKKIINSVNFENVNIANMIKQGPLWDIIICRNVFIYLTADLIKSTTKFFADSLSSNGVLILGPSDFIHVKYNLIERSIGGYLCYLIDQRQQDPKNKSLNQDKTKENENKDDKIKQRISDHHLLKKVQTYAQKQEQKSELLGEIRESLGQKHYKKLLRKVTEYENKYGESSIILQYKIDALLGMGDAAGALDYVAQALRVDRVNPKLFFLKGLAQMELSMLDEAEVSMRKVVAIDPSYVEAHYFLGMIFKMQMQFEKAVKKFNVLLNILEKENSKIHYLDVSKEELIEMVINEIG